MRCLVSGVAGFIGSHVADLLLKQGHTVVGVDDFSAGRPEHINPGVEFIEADLASPDVVSKLPDDVDVILHLAGQASGSNSFQMPVTDLNQNTVSTLNLITYGSNIKARRLIFCSSTTVYGDTSTGIVSEDMVPQPLSCYAVAKLAAERYLHLYAEELPFVIFRMSNVYGPRQYYPDTPPRGMISVYLGFGLETGKVTVMGSLDRFRDFIEVRDVARAWVAAAGSNRADGKILNLATGRPTTVKEILEGLKAEIPDLVWEEEAGTPGDQMGVYADVSRIKQHLDFEAEIGIESGLTDLVKWSKKQFPELSKR